MTNRDVPVALDVLVRAGLLAGWRRRSGWWVVLPDGRMLRLGSTKEAQAWLRGAEAMLVVTGYRADSKL